MAEIAGLWHDLGKMQPDFQRKLQSVLQEDGKAGLTLSMKVDHSTPGAAYAVRQLNMYGRILAYIIAGHHGGLPDWSGDEMGKAALKARLSRVKDLGIWEEREVKDFLFRPLPSQMPTGKDPAFWIRMVFSCLVDADFLDTERFFDPELSWRRTRFPSLSHLIPLFSSYIREKCEQLPIHRLIVCADGYWHAAGKRPWMILVSSALPCLQAEEKPFLPWHLLWNMLLNTATNESST